MFACNNKKEYSQIILLKLTRAGKHIIAQAGQHMFQPLRRLLPHSRSAAGRVSLSTPAVASAPASAPAAPTATAAPPAATPSPTAAPQAASPAPESDRIHSTDIAFKPNSAGWGYSKGYSKGFDSIFQKKVDKEEEKTAEANLPPISAEVRINLEEYLQSFDLLCEDDRRVFVAAIIQKYPELGQ